MNRNNRRRRICGACAAPATWAVLFSEVVESGGQSILVATAGDSWEPACSDHLATVIEDATGGCSGILTAVLSINDALEPAPAKCWANCTASSNPPVIPPPTTPIERPAR